MTLIRPIPLVIVAFLVLLFVILFYAVVPMPIVAKVPMGNPFSNHALVKHGAEAIAAEECGLNPMRVLYNPELDRCVDICKDSRGFWAVFIYKIVDGMKHEVTAYERTSAMSMSDVVDYMKRNGFTRSNNVCLP